MQAYNAADRLLLDAAAERGLTAGEGLVVNDEFGALSLPLGACCWTDSWLSAQAIQRNAEANNTSVPQPVFLSAPLPAVPRTVILRIPKQLALFEWQLARLAQRAGAETVLLAAAMDKHLPASAIDLMDHYWGETTRHRAVGKARMLTSRRRPGAAEEIPPEGGYHCTELDTYLFAGPNVFSRDSLDIGSRFLLEFIRNEAAREPVDLCLDLACGNGVLGLAALRWGVAQTAIFCDESAQALQSARRNTVELNLHGTTSSVFCHGDGTAAYNGPAVGLVLCNPPFHMGHSVEEYAGRRLLQQAAAVLRPGGELLAVTNRHLNYGPGLRRSFNHVARVADNRKFTLWSATH